MKIENNIETKGSKVISFGSFLVWRYIACG